MLYRRRFLGGVVVAAAAAGVARVVSARVPASPVADRSAALLGGTGVQPGARFGACTVEHVTATRDGAIAVHMRGSDERVFDLELMSHDELAPGVARAGAVGVYVCNHGTGAKATDEEHGLAAMALARHLRQRQAAGVALPALPSLAGRSNRSART